MEQGIKQLLGDRIGLEIVMRRKWGNGTILTPPGTEKKTDEAVIRYVGEGYKGDLKVNDRVLFDRVPTQVVMEGEKEIHIFSSGDILAKIEA